MSHWIKNRLIVIAILVGVVSQSIVAQEPATTPANNQEAIHDQLRELRDNMLEAIGKKDKQRVLALVDENVVITTQDGDKLVAIRGRAAVDDYLERLLTGPSPGVQDLKLNLKVDEKTILYGDKMGVAYGSSEDEYRLRSGASFTLPTRWMATVVQRDDGWKLAGLQVSTNLFENPVLNGLRNSMRYSWALAGGVGLLLGLFLGRRSRR